ncbi:MAG: zinc-dependent peptidase [Planctomycetes bacterium]|nr:zinc-dependent peptidase [Planctomycetota bacterium]
MFGFIKRWRRGKVMQQEFPAEWEKFLRANMGLYPRLTPNDQAELKRHMLVFLDEKHFEGCRGVEITDEMRVTIAGNACLLLLHRKPDYFPELVTILVYPSAFFVEHKEVNEYGFEMTEVLENAGESWDRGNVILSWDSAKRGALDPRDGLNVILHEFAHQLDSTGGDVDGAPMMDSREQAEEWAQVFQREYDALCEQVDAGHDTLIDDYATTNPAEFFAVCVETFFEKARQMHEHHPELYQQLKGWFKQDPASWRPTPAG